MKKIILSVSIAIASLTTNAQEIKFGAKVGLNMSTVKVEIPQITVGGMAASGETTKNSFKPGFHVGGFAEISLNDAFSLQPELHFSMQGSKLKSNDSQTQEYFNMLLVTESTSETNLNTMYINMPVLGRYNATEKLFFTLGPQIGYLISAKSKYESSGITKVYQSGTLIDQSSTNDSGNEDVKKSLKSIDFGVAVGGGFNITENIFTEVRYVHGLSNSAKSYDIPTQLGVISVSPIMKSSLIQLSFGYKF